MSTPKRLKGPWINRFAVRVFTLVPGVLFFWLLGFFVDNLGSLPGPGFETCLAGGKTHHAMLPHCQHGGDEESLGMAVAA